MVSTVTQTPGNFRIARVVAAWVGVVAYAALSALPAVAQVELTGQTMGSIRYSVKIESLPPGLTETEAHHVVDHELDLVNQLMSTYRADSDVSRFNAAATTDWFPVSPETCKVVSRALEISEISDGAFDVTVAPLVNLWNFGPNPGDRTRLPSLEQVAREKSRIGFHKLHVRMDPPALRKDDPQLWIDLSAIAEGYAADRVADALASRGVTAMLVDIGGELVARGTKRDGQEWRVGIIWPRDDEQTYRDACTLRDVGLATSGDYRNFTMIDGKRYSHTIDPSTGYPVDDRLASATVIASDSMTADAVATSVMVLGADKGHALCAKMRLPLLTYERDHDNFTMRKSDDFPWSDPAAQKPASANWLVFVAAPIIFGLVVAAMAIGVIFGNRRIAGSCGGIANLKDEHGNISCGLCSNPRENCRDPERLRRAEKSSSAGDRTA